MKTFIRAFALSLSLILFAQTLVSVIGLAQQEYKPQTSVVLVPDGTEFAVVIAETITSKIASEGDTVVFRVAEDVEIDGRVAIAKNALVKGIVADVDGRGMPGKAGKLSVRIDKTTTVDGQKIRLRAAKGKEGGSNMGKVIALIKEGTKLQVFTDEDRLVDTAVRVKAVERFEEAASKTRVQKKRNNKDWHKMSDEN